MPFSRARPVARRAALHSTFAPTALGRSAQEDLWHLSLVSRSKKKKPPNAYGYALGFLSWLRV